MPKKKSKLTEVFQARQGDVLLLEEALPPQEQLIEIEPRGDGMSIVALGEATGHHHGFARSATLYRTEDDRRFVRVDGTARLGDSERALSINAEIAAIFGDASRTAEARKAIVENVVLEAERAGFAALRHLGLDGKQADHKPIVFPAGFEGRVILPSEYAPGEIRRVED